MAKGLVDITRFFKSGDASCFICTSPDPNVACERCYMACCQKSEFGGGMHRDCFRKWKRHASSTCPMCREEIADGDDDDAAFLKFVFWVDAQSGVIVNVSVSGSGSVSGTMLDSTPEAQETLEELEELEEPEEQEETEALEETPSMMSVVKTLMKTALAFFKTLFIVYIFLVLVAQCILLSSPKLHNVN